MMAPEQVRTRRTRMAVIEAARDLFLDNGYAATTLASIADESETPQATVYRLFSSKLGLLKSLLDVSIAGDDARVAVADRADVRALLADADPRSQLRGFAAMLRERMGRTAAVHRILADAARADDAAAALLRDISAQRQAGQRRVAKALADSGELRDDLRERDVADLIHALASPELYALLVLDRGWKPERYEGWLADLLIEQLLAPRPRRRATPKKGTPR